LLRFTWNVQVPRGTSAIAPGGKPAKSAASQPLVLPLSAGLGTTRSTATSGAVTSPSTESIIERKSTRLTYAFGGDGLIRLRTAGVSSPLKR
jgi:hypothetical protein